MWYNVLSSDRDNNVSNAENTDKYIIIGGSKMSSVKNHAKRSSRSNGQTYGIFGMFAERARLSKARKAMRKMSNMEEK